MSDIIDLLKKKIDTNDILENEPMYKHTSIKVGGNADIFIRAHSIDDLRYILEIANAKKINVFILGNGSNLIVRDKGIRGIVVKIEIKKFNITKENEEVYVTLGAGNKIIEVASKLAVEGISGLEFASGIPGTIGGFVRMNAGAYGKEAKDVVVETTYMDYNGNIYKIPGDEHKFKYRDSIFHNNRYIILETKLRLQYGNIEEIKRVQEEYLKQRKEKQPLNFPSAGSIFKRGENFITAKIIDECGLKNCNIGDAYVSDKHAGFIINKGKARATDILELIEYIKNEVYKEKNIEIDTEVEIVGEE